MIGTASQLFSARLATRAILMEEQATKQTNKLFSLVFRRRRRRRTTMEEEKMRQIIISPPPRRK